MSRDVYVAGIGMIPFTKPGANEPYPKMAARATAAALGDAGISYSQVQQCYVGYVYGDSTAGQRALYKVGMTGVPVINVNNNCSTGSTALYLARQAVASGAAECVLALGFEQMNPGALGTIFKDRPSPFDHFDTIAEDLVGATEVPPALRYFGGAGLAHMKQYGTKLIICLIPVGAVDPNYVDFWRPWPKYFSYSLSADARHRRLAVALRQAGIPFFDLREDLSGVAGTYR